MNTQNVRRLVSAAALLVTALLLLPSASFAQASISGVVKDASGAVLPGVTVEASSPDLIEKVRSTTTDSSGQFRIVDLRAGTYSVSFSLTGFSTRGTAAIHNISRGICQHQPKYYPGLAGLPKAGL